MDNDETLLMESKLLVIGKIDLVAPDFDDGA